MAADRWTCSTEQTDRDQQHRMGLKRAGTHEQNGWMEPTGEADQGLLVPSVVWHILELSRTVNNITQTEENEILGHETFSEFTMSLRTSLDVSTVILHLSVCSLAGANLSNCLHYLLFLLIFQWYLVYLVPFSDKNPNIFYSYIVVLNVSQHYEGA